MTSEQVVQLGTIAQAMSIDDLKCLSLTDDELSALGGLTGWNTTKLSTLAERYMEVNSLTNLSSSIVSITTLGELICGFQPAIISTIDVNEVVDNSIQLGRLEDCSAEQYTAIKNLVADPEAYGLVETWLAADVIELNNILAGLTAEDITNLSTNALEGLSAQVISKLPGAVLAAMTDEQLESLMSSQIALVTDEQRQQMSTAQTYLLDYITTGIAYLIIPSNTGTNTGGTNTGTNTGNSNSTNTANANTTVNANTTGNASIITEGNTVEAVSSRAGSVVSTVEWILSLAVILILIKS